jgi:hypothetical protein
VRGIEREVDGENLSTRVDITQNCEPLLVETISPCEDSGEYDNDKSIGYVGDIGIPWLQSLLELPTRC